jgi:hypothetical protein
MNTQEKTDEIAGAGNHTTAEFWEYDTRLGRRWNVDPITYPWQSSYACFNNNPIYFADPSGLEGEEPPNQPPKGAKIGTTWSRKDQNGSVWNYKYEGSKAGWVGTGGELFVKGVSIPSSSSRVVRSVKSATLISSNEASYGTHNVSAIRVKQSGGGNTAFDKVLTWSGRVNDFVDATGKVSMVATGKAIARITVPAGVIIGVAQVGRGYYKDGNKFGYNTQKATTGFAGGLVGAWAGFEAGAAIGFEGGFVVGAAFGGIGAIPGAVIGGIVVGFGGAFGGAYYGGQFGESLIKK